MNITRQYRHLQRYRQIAEVLIKNGLGFLVDWLDLSKYLPVKRRYKKDENDYSKKGLARRVRMVLQELGPTYIKFGQLLSTRPDLLPPVYINELSKLQDRVKAVEFDKIIKMLEKEMGAEYLENFEFIEKEPVAAASIAQIHQAVLKDGQHVILKIQRPDIDKKVSVDLEIIKGLIKISEERNLFPSYLNASRVVEEFHESLKKELNFKREVANIERFKQNFSQNKDIIAPKIYKELSSEKIIVMEEIKGIKLNHLTDEEKGEIDGKYLAKLGARALMKQVLIDGFFHADPHPGNIFVVGEKKLAYVDFGMMGQLTGEDRDHLNLLFISIIRKDINRIIDILVDLGTLPDDINFRKFKLEIMDLFNRYYDVDLQDINIKNFIEDMQRILYNFKIRMPEEFFLLFRALGVSEGVGYMLDPTFNLVEVGQEFIKDILKDNLKPQKLFNRLLDRFWNIYRSTGDLPENLGGIVEKILNDEFTINFKHQNLDNLINKMDIISNRLAISLIISALIIGSSMILQTDMKPFIMGIPLFGFIGYIVAGVMGIWLVISIFRSGKF